MVGHNRYYDKLIKGMESKKDSIFEPCRITAFDPKKFTATIYGMRSLQVKENVIVLFPSLFLNAGIISFPVKDSTGIVFVGADNEAYLFPAQFLPPTREVTNGKNVNNASPAQYDEVLSLEHLEPGEHLIRSLAGSYIFVKNSGDLEFSTSKLHRLALIEKEGALEITVEKERTTIGNFNYYNGPFEKTTEGPENPHKDKHHIKVSFTEHVPKWETGQVLTEADLRRILLSDNPGEVLFDEGSDNTFEMQLSNVFSEVDDTPLSSDVDGDHLFLDFKIKKEGQTRLHANVSKSGAIQMVAQSSTAKESATFEFSDKKIAMALERDDNQYTMELREEGFRVAAKGTGGSELLLTPSGDVEVKLDEHTYSFKELMERVNQLSLLNKLEKL